VSSYSREEMLAEIKKLEGFQCYTAASMLRQCLSEYDLLKADVKEKVELEVELRVAELSAKLEQVQKKKRHYCKEHGKDHVEIDNLRAELKRVEAERDRLATAIRNQCANLCTEAWASRGKHHPDCLAYELDVANTAERCDYSEDQIADGMSAMDDHVGDREE